MTKGQPSKRKPEPPTPGGPTGGEQAGKLTPEEQKALPPVRQPDGTLRGQPGSNSGTQRGRDLKPRLFIPSVLIMAFTEEGELAHRELYKQRSGAQKRKRARARHAATLNAAKLVQRVMLAGAEGDNVATGHAIRILGLTHETLQPTPHEAAKGGQGPILTRFKRYDPTDEPPNPPSSIAPPPPERTKLIDPDGTEYVEPE